MQTTIPPDDLEALGSILITGLPPAAAAALELALAEQLTAEAELCGCPGEPGLCGPCAQLTGRAISHRQRASRLAGGE